MFILSMEFYVARLTLSEASIFPQPNMVELKLKEKKKRNIRFWLFVISLFNATHFILCALSCGPKLYSSRGF